MSGSKIQLHGLIDPKAIVDLKASTKGDALHELADQLRDNKRILDHNAFLQAMYAREELASTGVGLGIAIPHVKIPEVTDYVISVGRKVDGMEFDSLDGQPVRLFFMIGAAEKQTGEFVKILARVMRLLKDGANRVALLEAKLPENFLEIVRQDDLKDT